MTWTLVSASWTRMARESEWIAAFGGVVGRGDGQRDERQPGRDRDDRRARLLGERFGERGDQADRPKQVRRDGAFGDGEEGGGVDVFGFHDPGHQDENVQFREPAEDVAGGGLDRLGVGGVDEDSLDARVFGTDLFEERDPSTADDHAVAGRLEALCESETDA